jgi:RNA-directed DNA polymerase
VDAAISSVRPSAVVLRVNAMRGWCNYFKRGVSNATFSYLRQFAWQRVTRWLRRRHGGLLWKRLHQRFVTERGVTVRGIILSDPRQVRAPGTAGAANNSPRPGRHQP